MKRKQRHLQFRICFSGPDPGRVVVAMCFKRCAAPRARSSTECVGASVGSGAERQSACGKQSWAGAISRTPAYSIPKPAYLVRSPGLMMPTYPLLHSSFLIKPVYPPPNCWRSDPTEAVFSCSGGLLVPPSASLSRKTAPPRTVRLHVIEHISITYVLMELMFSYFVPQLSFSNLGNGLLNN